MMRIDLSRAAVLLAALLLAGCASAPPQPVSPAAAFADRWGVELLPTRVSAAGHLIDFRYRILDPDKAAPLLDRRVKPALIDENTGARLAVANPVKVGPLRSANAPRAGRVYFILFSNPAKQIRPGTPVTVQVGDFEARHLIVE